MTRTAGTTGFGYAFTTTTSCLKDITTIDGIPVTAPARTLLDIATCVDDGELKQALATALARKLTTKAELLAVMERYPHHAGKARLTSALGLPVG